MWVTIPAKGCSVTSFLEAFLHQAQNPQSLCLSQGPNGVQGWSSGSEAPGAGFVSLGRPLFFVSTGINVQSFRSH